MPQPNTHLNSKVSTFLDAINHPLRNEIEALRHIVLGADYRLTENIKWNGPNYSVDQSDRITMKIHPPKQLQLIFHRGAKVQTPPSDKLITDNTGLLTWKGTDRAVAAFKSMADIESNKQALTKWVQDWLAATAT